MKYIKFSTTNGESLLWHDKEYRAIYFDYGDMEGPYNIVWGMFSDLFNSRRLKTDILIFLELDPFLNYTKKVSTNYENY